MTRTILHVDMDAFFAAIEQRDRPELRRKPVIVGADPRGGLGRGIVSTCSYEARKFGVHSAQPISHAWRLCPGGIYVRPDMEKYSQVSERLMTIFEEFTDMVEPVSIDEAFLDVTGSLRLFGTGEDTARKIKARVQAVERLTASVGIASNKFVAKIASDLRKPDGLVVVPAGHEKEFLDPLPIGRLWGVGRKTEETLRRMGIERIGQLASADLADLVRRLGSVGAHLHELSNGIDTREVSPGEGFKSIGHETTFERDTLDRDLLHATLLGLTGKVAHRLRANHARARTITVKVRDADFTTRTRRRTLEEPSDTEERIFPAALSLMESLLRYRIPVRLIGVYGTNFEVEKSSQMYLFPEGKRKDEKLAAALDEVNRRFGDRALTRAALVRRSPPGRK